MKPADYYRCNEYRTYPWFRIDLFCGFCGVFDDIDAEKATRLTQRVYVDPYIDGERGCVISGWFFDDKPFMISGRAGRGLSDWEFDHCTDASVYKAAFQYMISLLTVEISVSPEDEDAYGLDEFYGYKVGAMLGKINK
jgi:hypothetical protein